MRDARGLFLAHQIIDLEHPRALQRLYLQRFSELAMPVSFHDAAVYGSDLPDRPAKDWCVQLRTHAFSTLLRASPTD
jgi:hypothetical protein